MQSKLRSDSESEDMLDFVCMTATIQDQSHESILITIYVRLLPQAHALDTKEESVDKIRQIRIIVDMQSHDAIR